MSAEKKLILEMVKTGKINIDEAARLLDETEIKQEHNSPPKSLNKKFIRIVVVKDNSTNVNINIPMALAEVGLKLIPKDALKVEGYSINIAEILQLVKDGNEGELVNINTIEEGKSIQVKISID